jgi:outer membrane protein assembly factor BamB
MQPFQTSKVRNIDFSFTKGKHTTPMIKKLAVLVLVLIASYSQAQPGSRMWSFTTGDHVFSSPAIGSDGTVYVGSNDGRLYARNPDGSVKWSYHTGNWVNSSPAIDSDGTVYVGSLDGNLYAFNPDGSVKWSFTTGGGFSSPAISFDGTIYVGSDDHRFWAINPDGSLKWSYTTGGMILSSPAIDTDGNVYVGSYDGIIYAIDNDGSLKWSSPTEDAIQSSPAIGVDGTIYVGSDDNIFYALDSEGARKWTYTTGSDIRSSPAIGDDGTIYVGSYDDKLYAFNPDGSVKWSYQTGDDVLSSPAIGSDGVIYVGSKDDRLYAIDPDGLLQWKYDTGNDIYSSPAIGSDGTIYIGSNDNKLYAFYSGSPGLADSPWPKFHQNNRNTGLVVCYEKDLAVSQIQLNDFVMIGYQNTIGVTIMNYGVKAAVDPPVVYRIGEENPITEIYMGTIDARKSALHAFATPWIASVWGDHTITAYTTLPDDEYAGNDMMTKTVQAVYENDVGVTDIRLASHVFVDFPFFVSAELTNHGYNDQSDFIVSYRIGSGDWITETFTGTLEPQQTLSYDFTSKWTPTELGDHRITARTELPGDQNIGNDLSEKNIMVQTPIPGVLRWTFETDDVITSSPAIGDDGTIYVGSDDRNLYAIYPDGTLKWNYAMTRKVNATPTVGVDGTIYIGVGNRIHAVNPDGSLKWNYNTTSEVRSLAIGSDGTIYASSGDKLHALNPDGSLKWNYTLGMSVGIPVVGGDDTIYVGDGSHRFTAINSDGSMKWYKNLYLCNRDCPSIGIEGIVYVSNWGYYINAIYPDGGMRWRLSVGGGDAKSSSITDTDGIIYVGCDDNHLYAIRSSKSLKWRYETGGSVRSSSAIGADGTIYVGSTDDHLYAINPDGSLEWKFEANGAIVSSPAIGDDGTIYVGCCDGKLYAIYTDSPGLADSPWPKLQHDNKNTGNISTIITAIEQYEPAFSPEDFYLEQNYPNPFNAQTTITYRLPERTTVSLKLFDVHGREVLTLHKGRQPRGRHQIRFDSRDLSSGIYFYRLVTEDHVECRRMLILK